MAQVLDEQLAEVATLKTNALFVDARRAVLAGRDVQLNGAPCGTRQQDDLLEKLWRAPAQSDERDVHLVEARQLGVRRQARIEHEMAGEIAVGALPECDEAEDLLG